MSEVVLTRRTAPLDTEYVPYFAGREYPTPLRKLWTKDFKREEDLDIPWNYRSSPTLSSDHMDLKREGGH